MTATVEDTQAKSGQGSTGRIARVIGPVVDIEFPSDSMPEMYNLLETELTILGETKTLSLEVAQHIGDGMVRAISLQPTDGLVRGSQVTDTGGPITVPVGDATLGHVFNTLGECLNLEGDEPPDDSEILPLYEFEPDAETVLDELLPLYVASRIQYCLLQAAASELASRQRAMKSATDNAEELIKKYTRIANQARQAGITQEISEIVGGVNALADANAASE